MDKGAHEKYFLQSIFMHPMKENMSVLPDSISIFAIRKEGIMHTFEVKIPISESVCQKLLKIPHMERASTP